MFIFMYKYVYYFIFKHLLLFNQTKSWLIILKLIYKYVYLCPEAILD